MKETHIHLGSLLSAGYLDITFVHANYHANWESVTYEKTWVSGGKPTSNGSFAVWLYV